MKHLSIDIETYSPVDLQKSGLYAYAQSPDFRVLLLAWSVDGGPVAVEDLTAQEYLSPELLRYMFDADTIKHAYNAAFEWYCLSRYFGLHNNRGYPPEAWLPQWRCTMLHGMYCGYPDGLGRIGPALGLPQDKQKDGIGKSLITFFCKPCKPTRANGGRTRNLPQHDPDRWALFKAYNAQDVVTEMAVEKALEHFPIPDAIQQQWEVDQVINARGVAIDEDLMQGALWCGETIRGQLMAEARALSGLDNPNSLKQLMAWLDQEIEEDVEDLTKDSVKRLLGSDLNSDAARRMLEIRQELGKTSTKKYNAMETAVCADGRLRGLLKFYGANRTGRWAGKIVQPQNLPRTHLEPLPLARDLVKGRHLDALRFVYGSIPDTLSQLIRTAFVASPGHLLVDADFSAIEARVIAWLAGEPWRLEVFRTHGKIYEASAEQMFGLPPGSVQKGDPMRQRGKVAELALGYQGGPAALIRMGALENGLTEEELPDIVSRWRKANPAIVGLWYDIQDAALSAVQDGIPAIAHGIRFAVECDPGNNLIFLTVQLPNGRKLYYVSPTIATNRWGSPGIGYMGMDQEKKKWMPQETYGGKLVENIVQAIARDCLAEAITRLEAAGLPVVFHVHDEAVLDIPEKDANLNAVCAIMGQPVPWAPGLPLGADGWVNEFYKKD